jgi:hypothetical protein
MLHSADEAVQRAEQLEREAHDAIAEFSLEDALRLVREALAIREASQGDGHPDLIWTLSLWIEALGRNTGLRAHWRRPVWASGAWRCGGRRSPALRTSSSIRSES